MANNTIKEMLARHGGIFASMESSLEARTAEAKTAPDPEQRLWERLSREYPHWRITQEIGTGIWYLECKACGFISMWRRLDFVPVEDSCPRCSHPFHGEPIAPKF